jgi:hypothetical protein
MYLSNSSAFAAGVDFQQLEGNLLAKISGEELRISAIYYVGSIAP